MSGTDSHADSHTGGGSTLHARVHVFPRREILDPQGKAIGEALSRLGFSEVAEVRAGRSFDIEIEAASEQVARERLEEMCRQLLANPVTEDFSFELVNPDYS